MKGLSLHLGLNSVDPNHYGWPGTLAGCENDARAMEQIARECKYQTVTLLTQQATADALLTHLREASRQLSAGDTFLLTYAGHGSQVRDKPGDDEEADGRDETWELFDRMFLDDELFEAWKAFAPGVRIILISDSCHSGTVARLMAFDGLAAEGPPHRPRAMPFAIALETVQRNRAIYEPLIAASASRSVESGADVQAGVILISGCQDDQLSADGDGNGLFTSKLLEAWKRGPRDYVSFHQAIVSQMPPYQKPNYMKVGQVARDFEMSVPFALTQSNTSTKGWCSMLGSGNSGCITRGWEVSPHTPGPFWRANSNPSPARGWGGVGGTGGGGLSAGGMRPWEVSGGVSYGSRCTLDMDIDLTRVHDMSDEQIFAFFQGEGAQLMMQAFVASREAGQAVNPNPGANRGWEISVGGSISGRGFGVEVKGTWKF